MTHYSNNPETVRADLFKDSGKWYTTVELNMGPYYDEPLIHDAVRRAYVDNISPNMSGMTVVVLEPYHKHSHPVMLKV